jgi:hypothetical protein
MCLALEILFTAGDVQSVPEPDRRLSITEIRMLFSTSPEHLVDLT